MFITKQIGNTFLLDKKFYIKLFRAFYEVVLISRTTRKRYKLNVLNEKTVLFQ